MNDVLDGRERDGRFGETGAHKDWRPVTETMEKSASACRLRLLGGPAGIGGHQQAQRGQDQDKRDHAAA